MRRRVGRLATSREVALAAAIIIKHAPHILATVDLAALAAIIDGIVRLREATGRTKRA